MDASWAIKGAEAAAALIEVDGVYNQDILLFAGSNPFVYRVSLGKLSVGKHEIVAKLNSIRSAPNAKQVLILSVRPVVTQHTAQVSPDDWLAITNSPVSSKTKLDRSLFSDIPIVMYYEVFHPNKEDVIVRYTTIFTNEDGGTPSAALMARWGRASDIEWVYEFRARNGEIVEENYQAVSHETKPFKGRRINGDHAVLGVASDNNNFSDELESPIRFALLPVRANSDHATRETIMDLNPWSYRIVTEELVREGKIKTTPSDSNTIADPREYVYVDLHARQSKYRHQLRTDGTKP